MAQRATAAQLRSLYGRYARLGIYDALPALACVGKRSKARRRLASALALQPGDRVLDIGCGTGLNFEALLAQIGAAGSLVGVDITPEMLDRAHKRATREGWANLELVHRSQCRYRMGHLPMSLIDAALRLSKALQRQEGLRIRQCLCSRMRWRRLMPLPHKCSNTRGRRWGGLLKSWREPSSRAGPSVFLIGRRPGCGVCYHGRYHGH
jgi:SAM-dependent methyltransferase